MRTGAIFARGSCRALKWMALLAVVFVLAAGSAAAQLRPPTNVTLTATAAATLTLSWAPPNGGDVVHGYQYRMVTPITADFPAWSDAAPTITTGTTTALVGQLDSSARSIVVSGLTAGDVLKAEVRVVGATVDGTTSYGTPQAPRNATVRAAPSVLTLNTSKTKDGDGEVTVTWNAPPANEGVTGFEYRYAEGTAIASSVKWTSVAGGSSARSQKITGLTNGLTYAIDVRAVVGSIKGAGMAAVHLGRPAGKPGKPLDLEFEPSSNKKSGELTWRAPNDNGSRITGYEYRYHDGSGSWTAWQAVPGGGAALSVTVSGLMADKTYTFEVRARNSTGAGEPASTDPSDTTDPTPGPGTLTGIRGLVYDVALYRRAGSRILSLDDHYYKVIGGKRRNHVTEGDTDIELWVQVEWTVKELREIYSGQSANWTPDPVGVMVEVMSDMADTTNWVSMIDGESQDVHFPNPTRSTGGYSAAKVMVSVPARPAASERDGARKYVSGYLRLYINQDDFEAENEVFYVEAVQTGSDVDVTNGREVRTKVTVIEDDDPQTVKLKGPDRIYEGVHPGGIFEVEADPPREDLPLEVRLDVVTLASGDTVRSSRYSLSDSSPTLNPNRNGTNNKIQVTLEVPGGDGNREDEEYQLKATVLNYALTPGVDVTVEPVTVPVMFVDNDKLPRLRVTPEEGKVKEGGDIELTLELDRNPANTIRRSGEFGEFTNEAVNVMLTASSMSTAGREDHGLPITVSFPARTGQEWVQTKTVKIMATVDDELGEAEMLVVDAEVDGTRNAVFGPNTEDDEYPGVSTLSIEDDTARLVWAKEDVEDTVYAAKMKGMGADDKFNPGEMIELMGSALFDNADGVTVSFSAESDDTDVAMVSVNGGMVTVTAGTKTGMMGHITVTAHASLPSGVKILDQTDPREASIKFPVEVGLAALSIMLSGPEDMMNLVEGGRGAMVTATANRMVTADTTVMLKRDRAMSSAGDEDFTAEPITILAGQTKGSTMVMAVEDNMMENDGDKTEKLVLYGEMEGDMAVPVEGGVEFYLWDAAVPALPVIAQLLLAAFLAVGGFRRYRRR